MSYEFIITAEPFAFGPASKAVILAEGLRARGRSVCLLVGGTALTLVQATDDLPFVDATSSNLRDAMRDLAGPGTAVVSVMDLPSLHLAQSLHLMTVWVDTLQWWWPEPPRGPERVDLFVEQRSIGDTNDVVVDRLVVPPITGSNEVVRRHAPRAPARDVLVNFGGMAAEGWYTPGKDHESTKWISEIVVGLARQLGWVHAWVVGNEQFIDTDVFSECDAFQWTGTMDHRNIIDRIADVDLVLTVPGLETPLEAWSIGTPTAFLPPTNSSQYFQLREYQRLGLAPVGTDLDACYPRMSREGRSLHELSEDFFRAARDLDADQPAQHGIERALVRGLASTERAGELQHALAIAANSFGTVDGAELATAAIDELVSR